MIARPALLAVAPLPILLRAASALACAAPQCFPGGAAPAAGATVPANATLVVWSAVDNSSGGDGPVPFEGYALLDDQGQPVATTAADDPASPQWDRHVLLTPSTPLTPGSSYTLRRPLQCDAYGPSTDYAEARFTADASAPLPTQAGTLTIDRHEVTKVYVGTVSGSCTSQERADTVRLTFVPSAELAPHLPLTRIVTTVDGAPWASTDYGQALAMGSAEFQSFRAVNQLHALCPPAADPGSDVGLTPGPHHVSFQVHVAGAVSDPPPIELDLDLDCAGGGCSVLPRAGSDHGLAESWPLALALVGLGCALLLRRKSPSPTR